MSTPRAHSLVVSSASSAAWRINRWCRGLRRRVKAAVFIGACKTFMLYMYHALSTQVNLLPCKSSSPHGLEAEQFEVIL